LLDDVTDSDDLSNALDDISVYEVHQHRTEDGELVIEFEVDEEDLRSIAARSKKSSAHHHDDEGDDDDEDYDDTAEAEHVAPPSTKKNEERETICEGLHPRGRLACSWLRHSQRQRSSK